MTTATLSVLVDDDLCIDAGVGGNPALH